MLNHAGRCYLVSVLASVRCLIRRGESRHVQEYVDAERSTMKDLARPTFDLVLGRNSEVYLEPRLRADEVTLDVLTETFRQAHLAGAVEGQQVRDAGDLFERLRDRVYGASRGVWFASAWKVRRQVLVRLKYLVAALEDVNRIEAVRLRLAQARTLGSDLDALDREAERLRPAAKPDDPVALALTGSA